MFAHHSRPRVPVDDDDDDDDDETAASSQRIEEAVSELTDVADKHEPPAKRQKGPDRTVPAEHCKSEMRIVFLNAPQLTGVLKAMKGLEQQNIMIDLHPERGFAIRLVHSGRTAHVYINIARERFAVFELDHARAYLVRFAELKNMCDTARADHVLALFSSEKKYPNRLCARLYAPACDRLCFMNVRTAGNASNLSRLPYREWKYPLRVSLTSKAFADELRHCLKQNSNSVEWAIEDGERQLVWRAFADKFENNAKTTVSRIEVASVERLHGADASNVTRQAFSTIFLSHIVAIGGASTTTVVHMGLAEYPVWLSFAIGDDAITVDGILLPREQDE